MIARLWRGVVAADRLDAYVAYVENTGVGAYRQVDGNRAAHILTRDLGENRAELVAFSLWDDVAAIRRFAGDDINAMVLYPEDEDYLLSPPELLHYDVGDGQTPHPSAATSGHTATVAEAFSGHRFRETYDHLAPDVVWTLVGGPVIRGRDAVIATCEDTLTELADGTTEFTRFRCVADDAMAAVDATGRYTSRDGSTSTVASCDIYEFRDGLVARITSYTVELDEQQGSSST